MKLAALVLYLIAFALDVAGVLVIVIDTRRDVSEMDQLLTKVQPTHSASMKRYISPSVFVDGPIGAYVGRQDSEIGDLRGFITQRREYGFWKRWLGVIFIVAGSTTGLLGNLASLSS